MTEKEFQQSIVELAKWNAWMIYHTFDSRRSTPGFPDLVLVRGAELVFAELKVGTGKVTQAQEAWLAALAAAGARVYVWRPDDWPAIEQILTRR